MHKPVQVSNSNQFISSWGRLRGRLWYRSKGKSVHNVKESEVGRAEWERYWARIDGDGTTSWLDARLTEEGRSQAKAVAKFWQNGKDIDRMPLLESVYSSPLARYLETARLSYSDLLPADKPFKLIVSEAMREINGVHTCDRRSSKTWIRSEFPECVLDAKFTEADEMWQPDKRETLEERRPVIQEFLGDLFDGDNSTFISLTTHSGAIRALCLAIGRPDVWVTAGAVVPIVIRRKLEDWRLELQLRNFAM